MSQPLGLRSIWISNQPCRTSAMVADRSLSSGFSACHLTVMVLARPEILGSFVDRAERTHFSASSIGNLALSIYLPRSLSDGSAQPLLGDRPILVTLSSTKR